MVNAGSMCRSTNKIPGRSRCSSAVGRVGGGVGVALGVACRGRSRRRRSVNSRLAVAVGVAECGLRRRAASGYLKALNCVVSGDVDGPRHKTSRLCGCKMRVCHELRSCPATENGCGDAIHIRVDPLVARRGRAQRLPPIHHVIVVG